jgi:IS605 OrfB family transposase
MQQTIEQYTWAFNEVCKVGWGQNTSNGSKLHDATYYTHRANTSLPSQLVCAARVKASEALKSAFAKKRKKQMLSCPQSKQCVIRYDARSYTIWFERNEVSIVTLKGRVKLSFCLPEYYQQYLSWKPTSADLVKDRIGRWWLHVVMETSTPKFNPTDETVGVDLGIANPATDSNNNFYGEERWKEVEERVFELQRRLQKKGTKSAKRHLKKLSGRRRRFQKNCDHVLSKRLIQSVKPGATLVFEDLTNIRGSAKQRKAQRRRFHSWSFAQFQAFVTYKAEARGIKVDYVDPRYTSQKCSQCGHIDRKNRPTQSDFKCKKCGYETHADYNAATNIRADYLRAAVNQPIVSTDGNVG